MTFFLTVVFLLAHRAYIGMWWQGRAEVWPYEAYVGPLQGERVRQKWTRVGVKKMPEFCGRPLWTAALWIRPGCGGPSAFYDRIFVHRHRLLAQLAWLAEQGLCNGRMSVCLSVRLSVPARAHSSKPVAAGLLLWARPAGDCCTAVQRSAAAAGECGQWNFVSVPRKLNAKLFVHKQRVYTYGHRPSEGVRGVRAAPGGSC